MRLAPLLVLPLLLTAACGNSTPASDDKRTVVVGAYPFAWLAERIGGSDITVTNLVKPGVEPHDLELTPRQVATIREASVVLYLKGFQPAVDAAVEGANAFDLGTVVRQVKGEGGELDPHVWLDPVLMKAMAHEIASIFGDTIGWEGDGYAPQSFDSADVDTQLSDLDRDIRAQLRECRTREIVTSHAAFGYLATRYGLVQRGISGLDPEAEPSPKRLAEVARFAREHHVTTIFFEALVNPKVARTVAAAIGAKTAVLDPIEGVSGTDDYLTVQRRNAAALHDALGCA